MAELDYTGYVDSPTLASGHINKPRLLDRFIDFSVEGNQLAAATDSLNIFALPAGTIILAGGIEQVTVGTATNTLQARVGTLALSGTLAGDAAVGTMTANATDAADQLPDVLAAAADFNLLSAAEIRVEGIVRAWVLIIESTRPQKAPAIAARDTSTGLS